MINSLNQLHDEILDAIAFHWDKSGNITVEFSFDGGAKLLIEKIDKAALVLLGALYNREAFIQAKFIEESDLKKSLRGAGSGSSRHVRIELSGGSVIDVVCDSVTVLMI